VTLVSGPILQVAWVVEDIAAAEARFTDDLGVARWMRIPDVAFGPDHCTYRGAPADFTIHVSLGYAGDQQLELIEPVTGDSLYTEHLRAHGPGLHHVAWEPADFEAAVAACGDAVAQQGSFPGVGMEFAYVPGGPLGSWVELMKLSDEMRAIFASIQTAG